MTMDDAAHRWHIPGSSSSMDPVAQLPPNKMDGTRAPASTAAPAVGACDEDNRHQLMNDVLDVDAMLSTMKQSAKRLDMMLQRLYAAREPTSHSANVTDENDENDDHDGQSSVALVPVAALVTDGTPVPSDVYFDAIRTSLADDSARVGHITHCALRNLVDSDPDRHATTALDAKTFMASTRDVTYMFPIRLFSTATLSNVDTDDASDDEWDMAEALSLDAFVRGVVACLESTDHAMPSTIADAVARALATALVSFSVADCELKAVQTLFPTGCVEPDTHVEWRRGNRICKTQATEQAWRRQWGVDATLTLETVVRAQSLSVAHDVGTARLGPALSCVIECRVFVPKTQYLTATKDPFVVTSRLRIALASDGEAVTTTSQPKAPTTHQAATSETAESAANAATLPEFLNVFHWGGHAALSAAGESSAAVPAAFDVSTRFQKLTVRSPFARNRIIEAACGRLHTLLLNDVGMVFSYGHAMDGALGHGDTLARTEVFVAEPKLVDFFFEKAVPIQSIACGGDDLTGFHSAAVACDGRVYTWGVGIALGLGAVHSKSTPTLVNVPLVRSSLVEAEPTTTTTTSTTPTPPSMVSIACGSGFCIALASDGSAFAWGKWSDGRLGLGSIPILTKNSRQHGNRRQLQRFQLVPRRLDATDSSPVRWRKVSCGDAHCVALAHSGRVYVWGRGRQGQLGLGDMRDALSPVVVSKKAWRDVAAGQDWSMAVDAHGAVWSWGACGAAVLGHGLADGDDADRSATVAEVLLQRHFQLRQQQTGTLSNALTPPPRFHWLRPQPVPSLSHGDAAIRSISAGARHAAAVSEHGDLYVWGSPQQGLSSQPTLVISSSSRSSTSDPVDANANANADAAIGSTIAERVFCGGRHVVALTSSSFLASAMQQLFRALQSQYADDHEQRRAPAGADVVLLVAGGKALYAHKLVLARRSAVLRDLILNEERPVENDSTTAAATPAATEVLLPQLRVEIARILLEFLYTDNLTKSLDPLSYVIRDVLRAAREFDIPRLVHICRERIASASHVPLNTLLTDLEGDEHDVSNVDVDTASPSRSLNHDLAFAFGDAAWSDLRIVAENRSIPVHRCLLIARSEYFRALLAFHDQHDASTPRELVVEESYVGMLRALNFIYNDELTTMDVRRKSSSQPTGEGHDPVGYAEDDERTEQLLEDLIAADKYGLVRMKRLCEHHIAVSPGNCLDVLVVADLVHAEHLKHVAMAFVQAHLHVLSEPLPNGGGDTEPSSPSVLQRLAREFPHLLTGLHDRIQRHTQQQTLLRDWQRQVERDVRAQHEKQTQQWHETNEATHFPWVPLMLAFVFATLYLTVMNAHESDYPVVPSINLVVVAGLLAAAFAGKI